MGSLRFYFSYIVHRPMENLMNPWTYFTQRGWWEGTSDTVQTRILNHNEKKDRVFDTGEPIVLSAAKIVELARGSNPTNSEDDPWLSPSLRQSGVEIVAKVTCNQKMWLDPLCDLQFVWASSEANIKRFVPVQGGQSSPGNPLVRLSPREYSGIRVHCETGYGQWEEVSLVRIIIYLASVIVYMTLPGKLLFWFTTSCLGHLSSIYKRCLVEPFNLAEDSAHAVLRMIMCSVDFAELAELSGGRGITHQMLLERLQTILRKRSKDLDSEEIAMMARFVHKELHKRKIESGKDIKGSVDILQREIIRFHGGRNSSAVDLAEPLSLDGFSEAISSIDKINFSSIIPLFDKDRIRTRLERHFTPRSLNRSLKGCRSTEPENRGDSSDPVESASESLETRKKQQTEAVVKWNDSYEDIQNINNDLQGLIQRQIDTKNDLIDLINSQIHERHTAMQELIDGIQQCMNLQIKSLEELTPRFSSLEQRVERFDSMEKRPETVQQMAEQNVLASSESKTILEKQLASFHAMAATRGTHHEFSSVINRVQIEHEQQFTRHFEVLQSNDEESLSNRLESTSNGIPTRTLAPTGGRRRWAKHVHMVDKEEKELDMFFSV